MTEKTYPHDSGGYTILGPELFAHPDNSVIAWQGENFYRACGMKVADLHDGGMSTCVKRIEHPGKAHEDFDGRIYHEIHGFEPDFLEIPTPRLWPSETLVSRSMIKEAWDNYILPTQEAGEAQSEPMRTVMACLRIINDALPREEEQIEAVKPGLVELEVDDALIPVVVVDEVDGPCEKCGGGNNEWKSDIQDNKAVLVCTTCSNVRIDR